MKLCQRKTRVIIAGSREFIDQYRLNKVCNWIFAYKKIAYNNVEIISGTCRGADIMGEKLAENAAKETVDEMKTAPMAKPSKRRVNVTPENKQ